jgi:hypothetical protein
LPEFIELEDFVLLLVVLGLSYIFFTEFDLLLTERPELLAPILEERLLLEV